MSFTASLHRLIFKKMLLGVCVMELLFSLQISNRWKLVSQVQVQKDSQTAKKKAAEQTGSIAFLVPSLFVKEQLGILGCSFSHSTAGSMTEPALPWELTSASAYD